MRKKGVRRRKEGESKDEGKPQTIRASSEKKKRRFRPDTVALRKIRRFQKTMGFLICKLSFMQWMWEIMQEQCGNLCFQSTTLIALQEVAEAYVVGLFEDVNMCAIHALWVRVMPKDSQLAIQDLGGYGKNL